MIAIALARDASAASSSIETLKKSRRRLPDGRGGAAAASARRHPCSDHRAARSAFRNSMRMTGHAAKSAISNAGDWKALSGALSHHAADCQDSRLGRATHQSAAAKANHSRKRVWRTAIGALTMPKGNPNGKCRLNVKTRTVLPGLFCPT